MAHTFACCSVDMPGLSVQVECCGVWIHALCVDMRQSFFNDTTCPGCQRPFDPEELTKFSHMAVRECSRCQQMVWSSTFHRVFECDHPLHLDCAGEQFLINVHLDRPFQCVVCRARSSEDHVYEVVRRAIHLGWHATFDFLTRDRAIAPSPFRTWLTDTCLHALSQCEASGLCKRYTLDAAQHDVFDFEAGELKVVQKQWSGERAMAFVLGVTRDWNLPWGRTFMLKAFYKHYHECTEQCNDDRAYCLIKHWNGVSHHVE